MTTEQECLETILNQIRSRSVRGEPVADLAAAYKELKAAAKSNDECCPAGIRWIDHEHRAGGYFCQCKPKL